MDSYENYKTTILQNIAVNAKALTTMIIKLVQISI